MRLRFLVVFAILGAVLVVAAATFAWWLLGLIVFLAVRSGHGCRSHRRHAGWHRPPHVRRV